MMNTRIEHIRRRAADLARDQTQARFRINGWLVFSEHDQCRPALVESRVHAGGDLHSTCQREPNMRAIPHFICSERAFDFVDDFFGGRNFSERKCAGGTLEAIEMFVELEDAAVVKSQS